MTGIGGMTQDALRILILEDVPMDAELVEYELGRARIPFLSRRVDSRDGFLRELEEFHPDVILSDYTLPRFDGMTALSLTRERAPAIPFLIVTGSVNEETAVGCMKPAATERRFRSLVQNSSDLVTIVAPDSTILYASDSAERLVGYAPGQLVGTTL